MDFLELLRQPWPWYVAGPLIGLTVPVLLLIGNKNFGISSSLRHICAACIPANISYFKYDWKNEIWNLFFVFGILGGGYIGSTILGNPEPLQIADATIFDLKKLGLTQFDGMMPAEIFSTANILSLKGLVFFVFGGFMVGFGTRYANGCTSGHSIMGLSNLQLSSLIATICFMIGGIVMTNFIFPFLFKLIF